MNAKTRDKDVKTVERFTFFEVNLSVKFKELLQLKDHNEKSLMAAGYFRKFVVVATSVHKAQQLLSSQVEDGEIDWQESEIKRMSTLDLDAYSLSDEIDFNKPGIVFRSSHFLYPSTEP